MTDTPGTYYVALFKSVSHVIQAERILKKAQVPHKIIPVPREISSDCGVCIRFLPEYLRPFEEALSGRPEDYKIQPL